MDQKQNLNPLGVENGTTEFLVKKSNEANSQNDFIQFFKSIPILKKGYKAECYNLEEPNLELKDINQTGGRILGRLNKVSDLYPIVYVYAADLPLPILEVYDDKSQKLKSFELFNYGYCTDLMSDNQFSSFEIIDSVNICINSYIKESDSITITKSDTINWSL